jgi:hypothetical protein
MPSAADAEDETTLVLENSVFNETDESALTDENSRNGEASDYNSALDFSGEQEPSEENLSASEASTSESDEFAMVNETDKRMLINSALSRLKPVDLKAANISEEFEKYDYAFDEALGTVLTPAEITSIDASMKINLWRSYLGEEVREILRKAVWGQRESKDAKADIKKKIIASVALSSNNPRVASAKFWARNQRKGETAEQWLKELENLAALAEMGTGTDENLINAVARGHRNKETRKSIRAMATKKEAWKEIRNFVILEDQLDKEDEAIEQAMKSPSKQHVVHETAERPQWNCQQGASGSSKTWHHNNKPRGCRYCGKSVLCRYLKVPCAAFGHKCKNCSQWNHFEGVCEREPNLFQGKLPQNDQNRPEQPKNSQKRDRKKEKKNKKKYHVNMLSSDSSSGGDGSDNEAHEMKAQLNSSSSSGEILRGGPSPRKQPRTISVPTKTGVPEWRIPRVKQTTTERQAARTKRDEKEPGKECKKKSAPKSEKSKKKKESSSSSSSSSSTNSSSSSSSSSSDSSTEEEEKSKKQKKKQNKKKHEDVEMKKEDTEAHHVSRKNRSKKNAWYEDFAIHGRRLRMKIDSGATCSIMPLKYFKKLGLSEEILKPTRGKLLTYAKGEIFPLGKFSLPMQMRGRTIRAKFLLIEEAAQPLLGFPEGVELGLFRIDVESLLRDLAFEGDYEWELDEITELPPCKFEVSLRIEPNTRPVILPPRRLPIQIRDKVKEELDRMQTLGVIEPVSEPSEWCHQMVVADKPNGKLRVCMDPKHLNKVLKREEFQIPDFETLSCQLAEAKIMTTIDLTSGFWQFGVDSESAKLLTFATPFGRYRYKRLPFGLSCAPEMFHKRIVEVLSHIPGVIVYIDDILVWGRTQQEHDERLQMVLDALREAKLSINDSKCEVGKTRVKFLGHGVEDGKLYPDTEKIKAIKNFPSPMDKKSLKRFLGMMSYLRKFIRSYNEMTDLFRPLLKERHAWLWTPEHEAMMNKIRAAETWTTALRIYQPGKPVELYVDASSTGLGAVLLQEKEPVYFASRSLTPAEEKYPQIEKELLALVWAFERLDLYTYGTEVVAYTDHKPSVGLKEKPLDYLSTCQQRFMGRLQRYHFELRFIPGKEMVVPDCLSRAPVERDEKLEKRTFMGTDIDAEAVFVSAIEYTALSDELRRQLEAESTEDSEYQAVLTAYREGWEQASRQQVGEYWSERTEYFVEDSILYFRGRPVVPKGARERFLQSIHRGHVGMQVCLRRAQRVWWPGMNQEIKQYVQTCHTCQSSADQQRDEPMKAFEVPVARGLVVGSDVFDSGADQYVIFVDLFSNWIEFFKIPTKDTKNLIKTLRNYMTRNGVPRVFTSDKGSAYRSHEFAEFCKEMGIKRADGSAKHERGNAHAEASVKKIKKLLARCRSEDEVMKAILAWHQAPIAPRRPSPAQIHLGRNVRDELHWNVQQACVQWSEVRSWKEEKQLRAKQDFEGDERTGAT